MAAESRGRLRALLNAVGPEARDLVDAELLEDYAAGRRRVPRYLLLTLEYLATSKGALR